MRRPLSFEGYFASTTFFRGLLCVDHFLSRVTLRRPLSFEGYFASATFCRYSIFVGIKLQDSMFVLICCMCFLWWNVRRPLLFEGYFASTTFFRGLLCVDHFLSRVTLRRPLPFKGYFASATFCRGLLCVDHFLSRVTLFEWYLGACRVRLPPGHDVVVAMYKLLVRKIPDIQHRVQQHFSIQMCISACMHTHTHTHTRACVHAHEYDAMQAK